MAGKVHHYTLALRWTGNRGAGTVSYSGYDRAHEVTAEGKDTLIGSADPSFRGDPALWNPEELLVASLSACHMLWYLSLCSTAGVVVTGYVDDAKGTMVQDRSGAGGFSEVILRPAVTVAEAGMAAKAEELHAAAHENCFIARSVRFPVRHEPSIAVGR